MRLTTTTTLLVVVGPGEAASARRSRARMNTTTLHRATKEPRPDPPDAEETTVKYGLEAGLWKVFTSKGESGTKPIRILFVYNLGRFLKKLIIC